MNIFGWFKKKRFDTGAIVVSGDMVRLTIARWLEMSKEDIIVRDRSYLILEPERMKEFVFKYYHPKVDYHSNSDEFPDCDDFDLMARGSIAYGAVREGFLYHPAFGGISYKRMSGGWHRADFSIMYDLNEIFEPQNMLWKDAKTELALARGVSL